MRNCLDNKTSRPSGSYFIIGIHLCGRFDFMNEPNVNGSHPAMLATQHCNSDVQLFYRLPLTKQTHSDLCLLDEQCLQIYDINEVAKACQLAQDVQAG